MIASQHNNVTREVEFDGEEKHADFNAKDATVNIIAKEQIVKTARLTRLANHIE